MKQCTHCKQIKPLSEFYKVSGRKGNQTYSWCKKCMADLSTKWKRTPRGRAFKREERDRWRRKKPNQVKANLSVLRAIKRGEIIRGRCQVCGDENTHGHHYLGYSKEHWLDVMWLCPKHHREAHSRKE